MIYTLWAFSLVAHRAWSEPKCEYVVRCNAQSACLYIFGRLAEPAHCSCSQATVQAGSSLGELTAGLYVVL